MYYWSFKAKLKLKSRNRNIQYGHQAAVFTVTSLWKSTYRLLSAHTSNVLLHEVWTYNVLLKFGLGHQAAILKVTSLKINRLLSIAILNNMHMKFPIEIPKQTWVSYAPETMSPTDGRTDGRTGGQGESNLPVIAAAPLSRQRPVRKARNHRADTTKIREIKKTVTEI